MTPRRNRRGWEFTDYRRPGSRADDVKVPASADRTLRLGTGVLVQHPPDQPSALGIAEATALGFSRVEQLLHEEEMLFLNVAERHVQNGQTRDGETM